MFIDKVTVILSAGKGGNGIVAWHRAKYLPKGGPAGGNGGKGGDVIVRASTQIASLDSFRNRRSLSAENGKIGGPNGRQGGRGKPLVVLVPCGTTVRDLKTGDLLADLTDDGQEIILCFGGNGGRGNKSFASSRNRAPVFCTEGKPGQAMRVELELKLIADVGLVGFPNAGKSTLISSLSKYPVKVGAYPFTKLHPYVRYINTDDYSRILLADIPGIISGASDNRGLGLEFLRHVERTKMIVYVLDASGIDGRTPYDDLKTLQEEIGAYNSEILQKPALIVLNKTDCDESAEHIASFHGSYTSTLPILTMSAKEGEGLDEFLSTLEAHFASIKASHIPLD